MHQMELAQRLSGEILKHSTKESPVTVLIGELLAIEPDELVEILEMLGHTNVSIEMVPSLVQCKCGYKGTAEIYHRDHHTTLFRCPKCQHLPDVEMGEEMKIKV